MKMNMDLIREILIWCEDNIPDRSRSYLASEISFTGFTSDQIIFHFKLLIDSGYINAVDESTYGEWDYFPEHLTMEGYEFLEAIKSDTVWNGMKEEAGKIGIQAVKFAIPILAQIIAKQAGLA